LKISILMTPRKEHWVIAVAASDPASIIKMIKTNCDGTHLLKAQGSVE